MPRLHDELLAHLRGFTAAPFLFVGAGMSRRYLGLDGWEALLRRFAEVGGKDYDYYYSSADGSFQRIASLIAEDVHEAFWTSDEYAALRDQFAGQLKTRESALKALIGAYAKDSLSGLPTKGTEADELVLLKDVIVDGVITTNYDPLMEHLFDDFEVFVGQDRLLFSEPQGVAEIYKIHGSHEEPDSLVLTESDYTRFRQRNPYLAAKLLTIFVEHPVVFLGYSLGDSNITEILHSIAAVLTNERLNELQDRLVFIQWNEDAGEPVMTGTAIAVGDGLTIPVKTVTVSSFEEVYTALASLERKFPARLLRHLKEKVYELVRDNDPQGQLYVQDLDADIDVADVDVVLGVGAIEKVTQSYRGLSRRDLLDDLMTGGTELRPGRVLEDVVDLIPNSTYVPVYKYLREAGLLDKDGILKDSGTVPGRVRERVEAAPKRLLSAGGSYAKAAGKAVKSAPTFAALRKAEDDYHVMLYLFDLPEEGQNLEAMRKFLLDTRDEYFQGGAAGRATFWARAACLYDYLKYGKQLKPPKRTARPRPKKPKGRS